MKIKLLDELFNTTLSCITKCLRFFKMIHKKIILGKNGHSIKAIGSYSRLEMEKVLKCKCNLFLKVVLKKSALKTLYTV